MRAFASTHVLTALALTGLALISPAAAANFPDRSGEGSGSPPLRIYHFSYREDGVLKPGPWSPSGTIQSVHYGAPLHGFEYVTEPPDRSGRRLPAGLNDPGEPVGPPVWPRPIPFQIERWSAHEGLPSNKVRSIYQDRNGYLWVGTESGIARFDGHQFVGYDQSSSETMREHGAMGRAFHEDDDGHLWIGTDGGLLRFHRGEFKSFPGQETLQGIRINALIPRSEGGFWIASDRGAVFWNGQRLSKLETDDADWHGRILTYLDEGNGTLWIGSSNGLLEFDLERGTVLRRFVQPGVDVDSPVPKLGVFGLLRDRHQRLWIGTDHFGVWRLENNESTLVKYRSPTEQLFGGRFPKHARFAEDAQGNIWATAGGFAGGVLRFAGEFRGTEVPLYSERIGETFAVFVCREGAVWIGGREGLFRLRPFPFATLWFDGVGGREWIRYVSEGRDGALWFGSRRFYARWSRNQIMLIDLMRLQPPPAFSGLQAGLEGSVWAGFPGGGVFHLPVSLHALAFHEPVQPRFPRIGEVQAISPRRQGGLWFGTRRGVFQQGKRDELVSVPDLEGLNVSVIREDEENRLWVGTFGQGLHRLDSGRTVSFTTREGLGADVISSLHIGTGGVTWIGTEAGLSWFREGQIVSFGPESGLPQRTIDGICEDDLGRVWLSHDAGISRVKIADLADWSRDSSRLPGVAEFGSDDGMLSVQGSGPSASACLEASDGRLWFAKRGGLVVTDPASLYPEAPAPVVLIEGLTARGRSYEPASRFELPPGSGRELGIKFTCTSLHSPEKVLIQYQLQGHDAGWRKAESVRRVIYANVPPGEYQFRVRARNHEGRWSRDEAVLAIGLAPYFWQTWIFRLSCGAAAAALGSGLVAARLRRQRRRLEHERLEALRRERARIARDIHDHLGAQLAVSALSSVDHQAGHALARESLGELNDLIWSVDPEQDTLQSLVDFIANFSSRWVAAAGLKLDLQLPEAVEEIQIDSRLRLEAAAALKESMNNVLKHAEAKCVTVELQAGSGWLRLVVRDDGRGFDPNRRSPRTPGGGSGHGLHNLNARAADLGGKCRIDSQPGRGTEVEWTVPVKS